MRRTLFATTVTCALLAFAASAGAQTRGGAVAAFGGTTFGSSASAPTFGASITVPLGDHVQIVGEAGRLTDIKASLLDDVLDFSSVDIGMSAWYGEAGLRLTPVAARAAVRPYVEATAGVARLKPSVGVDGWLGSVTNTGLAFLGTTEPMVGAGGGVVLQGGAVSVDLGYRYKRILADGGLASAFSLGNGGYDVNQARVAVGVRF